MVYLGAIILVSITLFLVGHPVFADQPLWSVMGESDAVDLTSGEKQAVFTELNELEYDYRMNKLSREDYLSLKKKLQSKAVEVIKNQK